MKKIFLFAILLLLFTDKSFAQRRKAVFKLDYVAKFGFHSSRNLCGDFNHYQLKIKFPAGNDHTIYDHGNGVLEGNDNWDEQKTGSLIFFMTICQQDMRTVGSFIKNR